MDTIPYFTRVDRYFAGRFLWYFMLCLFIGGSLFLVFDFFPKIDDVSKLFQDKGTAGTLEILAKYYTIHISHVFRLLGGIPILLGAAQALYTLEKGSNLTTRGGEVIPILTSGFSRWRVAIPFLYTGIFLVICSTVLNECFLPGCYAWPGANSNNFSEEARVAFTQRDLFTGVEIQGESLDLRQKWIRAPRVVVPPPLAERSFTVSAAAGQWYPESESHPAGYLMTEVEHFAEIKRMLLADPIYLPVRSVPAAERQKSASKSGGGQNPKITENGKNSVNPVPRMKLLLLTEDQPWIPTDAIFFCTDVMPSGLYKQGNSFVPISLPDLRRKIASPSVDRQLNLRVEMHSRILQPLLDVALLMTCLPLLLSGRFRSKLFITGMLVGMSCLYMLIPSFTTLLGREGAVTPMVAAWIPVFVFYSLAALLFEEYYT